MKENSIEEDIARIAKLITTKFNNDYSIDNKDKEAIEHILSDYKRVLKENERYRRSDYETICLENNELRETVDRIQSEYNDLLKEHEKLKYKIEGQECVIETQAHNEEVYERIFERLEKENEKLKNALNVEQK